MAEESEPTPEERANRRNIREKQRQIEQEFDNAINRIFANISGVRLIDGNYSLSNNRRFELFVNSVISTFKDNVQQIISQGVRDSFALSVSNFTNLIERRYSGAIDPLYRQALNFRYEGAMNAFLSRVEGGLNLSDRVWNIARQFQRDIEYTIFTSLSDGRSADQMSRDIRRYLKNPDQLFRRVRDAKGKLQLSQRAKLFNPGQGVYRSSYKNARRVSRTEINTANRTQDFSMYNSTPFVLGIEVKLSAAHPKFDMCDYLVGVFPPTFKFTGFHIQCICFSVPILASKDEFRAYQRAVLAGTDKDFVFEGKITEMPKRVVDWVISNKDQLNRWKTLPSFMYDNPKLQEYLK